MKREPFIAYSWGVVAYNLAVIAWGAYVRATGSGAGCGSHWPLCNGELIPRAPQTETLIEFTHRISSGLALLMVIGLVVWAVRLYPKGAAVRRCSWGAFGFMISESLVGAGLVVFELVADNTSVYRATWMAVHLINTFLLLMMLTLIPWLAAHNRPVQLRLRTPLALALALALLGLLWVGASGAVTALGDTIFAAASLSEGIQQDFAPAAHFLVRLRVWHPVIAVLVGGYMLMLIRWIQQHHDNPAIHRLTWTILGTLGLQLAAGVVNVVLLAPVWLQLVHLLLANVLWIAMIALTADVLTSQAPSLAAAAQPVPRSGDAYPLSQRD